MWSIFVNNLTKGHLVSSLISHDIISKKFEGCRLLLIQWFAYMYGNTKKKKCPDITELLLLPKPLYQEWACLYMIQCSFCKVLCISASFPRCYSDFEEIDLNYQVATWIISHEFLVNNFFCQFSITPECRSSSYCSDILLFNLFCYLHIVFTLTNNNVQDTAEDQEISAMPTFMLYKNRVKVNIEWWFCFNELYSSLIMLIKFRILYIWYYNCIWRIKSTNYILTVCPLNRPVIALFIVIITFIESRHNFRLDVFTFIT